MTANSFYRKLDPASVCWIGDADTSNSQSWMMEYRLELELLSGRNLSFCVTADQYYILYLDGMEIGRSNDRGSSACWFVDSYEPRLTAGKHVITVVVWSCGELTAHSVESHRPGFLCCPRHKEDIALIASGTASWRMRRLCHTAFVAHHIESNGWTGCAPCQTTDYNRTPGIWETPVPLEFRHELYYSSLSPLPRYEHPNYGTVLYADGQSEPNSRATRANECVDIESEFATVLDNTLLRLECCKQYRVIIRLDNYTCGWLRMSVGEGRGSRIRITWAESLFEYQKGMEKGVRDGLYDKFFRGVFDEFILDGTRYDDLESLVWRAGNFIELIIVTGDAPLLIYGMKFISSNCPFWMQTRLTFNHEEIDSLIPICLHTFQMTTHDNFVDCPYYEQIPYVGDGRIQALVNYTLNRDDRLVRKMLFQFQKSCQGNGLCKSRTPSRLDQYIPSFSLWYVGMIHDYARWRNDPEFVRAMLPGMRSTLRYFINNVEKNGIYHNPDAYWNFMDWVPEWQSGEDCQGVPPASTGANSTANWQLVYALNLASELEAIFGEDNNAEEYRCLAIEISQRMTVFFDPSRGLYADDMTLSSYSEHAQIMAILSNLSSAQENRILFKNMLSTPDISRCSLFYTHYFWDAARQIDSIDNCFSRINFWNDCLRQKFRTIPETFNQSRSDCHGWGAMLLYHLTARIGGINPGNFGFSQVEISPMPGSLTHQEIECAHPYGIIRAEYQNCGEILRARITLPKPLTGSLSFAAQRINLHSGYQSFELPATSGRKTANLEF